MSTSQKSTREHETPVAETARVRGEALTAKVKELLHEGNVRRITVRNEDGHIVIEIPVTAGLVAAVAAPVLVAVAAIAALANSWVIEIDRAPGHIRADDQFDSHVR